MTMPEPMAADAEEARRNEPIDEDALEELDLYINNTGELYPQKKAILQNLSRHLDRGDYDPGKAVKLWAYWVETGAKRYAKEYAKPEEWSRMFPKNLRDALAHRVAEREYNELMIQRAVRSASAEAGERATVLYEEPCGCPHSHPPSVPTHRCRPHRESGRRRELAEAGAKPRREPDPFTMAYIEAAIWSSTSWDDDIPLDRKIGLDLPPAGPVDDAYRRQRAKILAAFAPSALAEMKKDTKSFQEHHKALLKEAYKHPGYDEVKAGHDFWLTRNGHGAGFWDRGLGRVGEELTEAAKAYGSSDLYIGDDGKLYATEETKATEASKKPLRWHEGPFDSRIANAGDQHGNGVVMGYRIDKSKNGGWVVQHGEWKNLKKGRRPEEEILGTYPQRKEAKAEAERHHQRGGRLPPRAAEANEKAPTGGVPEPTLCAPYAELIKGPEYDACMKAFEKLGPVLDAKDVYRVVHKDYERQEQESFRVLVTDVRGGVRGYKEVAKGQRDRVVVGMDDLMRYVLATGGKRFFIMHNHPTGEPDPSPKDKDLTKRVDEAAKFFDTELADHVIVGRGKYYSFATGRVHKA